MDFYLYLLGFILIIFAQSMLQSNYQKFKKIENVKQIKGCDAARMILDRHGLYDVKVVPSNRGTLSDYYDPTNKIVALSSDIYYNSTIASVAVAAHEVGHAIQHAEHYGFIALRNKILPATQIASQLGWVSIFLGLFLSLDTFFWIGVASLFIILLFQLITLPIELNASNRAIIQLNEVGIIVEEEQSGCRKMLNAAAFTNVAALLSTIIQILRIFLIRGNDRD